MESYNPYEKIKKSKIELYQEKLKKRNETQDWIFGNSFGKPGGGAPLRDNQGNVVSSFKSITENNIYKYAPNDFSRGNNNVSMINHKLFNKLNNNQLNSTVNNNQNVPNVNQQKIINSSNTHNINYNIIPLQNRAIINRNNSSININPLQNKSISFSPNIYTPIQNYQNSPLILILPPSLSLSSQYNNQISNNNIPNIIYEKNINQSINYNINNNININSYNNSDSSFGNDSKKKEEQNKIKKQEYRNELLLQINEKRKKDEERKRKMEEDEKLEKIKNEEYFLLKQKQAEEQARKLRERINRRMQKPLYEEMGSASNILEISKDFENVNKSFQGESPLNNNIEEIKQNENENEVNNESNFLNIDDENIYGDNMILEEEHYINKLEEEYKLFHQSLSNDIDKQIKTDKNLNDFTINYNEKEKNIIIKKQNKLADYIMGNVFTPPTPIKPLKNDNNILYNSYSQTSNPQSKNLQDLQNFQKNGQIKYNTLKNKTVDLEDFFNRDENKKDNYNSNDIKEAIKAKEVQDTIEQNYNSIFNDLKLAHDYTKKYTKKNDDDILENSTTSFYSSTSTNKNKKENNKSQQQYYNRSNASRFNSSISYSNYEKEQINDNKKNNELIKENISDNEMIDENSLRNTGNKNVSKTVLDKELRNIQENKEDEEDEEDDEKNQNKESNKSDNSKNSKNDKNEEEKNDEKNELDSNKDKNEENNNKDMNENDNNEDINEKDSNKVDTEGQNEEEYEEEDED